MKQYIILSMFIIAVGVGYSQQLQTSSMYELQGVLHNPSMAGMQDYDMAGINYRSQWNGISGAPKTLTAFGSFSLPKHKIGIGGYLYSDKTGPTSRTGVQLALAKHIVTLAGNTFSMGIETRLMQYSLDKAKLVQTLGSDPVIGGSDNRMKFDAGFGISYKTPNWQVGASVSQLVQSKLDFYTGNLTRTEEARLYRHYYLHGLYKWKVDGATTIIPNTMIIYLPNAPADFIIGARVEHNSVFWWGLGYRARQSYMLSAGVNINKKITLGYSFEDYVSPISTFDGGQNGHELLLRYNWNRQ
jgi:type IX secretion system PorP/SprF family membrane protein